MKRERTKIIPRLLDHHFAPATISDITVTERKFPVRVRADLQRAIDKVVSEASLFHFCGVRKEHAYHGINFSELLILNKRDNALSVPPEYEEIDIGEDERIKCLKSGLWLLSDDEGSYAVFLEPEDQFGRRGGIRFQVATISDENGAKICQRFFRRLEKAVQESSCYRGKILSLELPDRYTGVSGGIAVQKLRTVEQNQVILPKKTLTLLDRNVIRFVEQRAKLTELQMAAKKGLLFYGPPGTGKTHTIHYLAGALKGHTTLIITAAQVALLSEYMSLARLLQPSIVVIEDVDLIARDRTAMHGPCEESLLNSLLNEMDGMKQDADVLFILTTNRPEELEVALASRPGRVDQAIEFPLPDDEGREKLINLYSRGATIAATVVETTVKKTDGVSASFIKELMRRSMQFHLEKSETPEIELDDVENALEELIFVGGTLNRKLLGGVNDSEST